MDENAIQNIILENRKKATVSGVKDMLRYSDEEAVLLTALGKLTIRGTNIKIVSFNTETGDMFITGSIYALVYTDDTSVKDGFFKRLVK